MSLVLSTCVLLISLMQSVNRVQFLNTSYLATLSGFANAIICAINIVPLTSIYASL